MTNKKYIAVFCSASNIAEKYTTPAKEFAMQMAQQGYSLVWGGSDEGLMKQIADTVESHGGELIGVSIDVFQHVLRKNMTETILAPTLGERKTTMLMRADAVVALVGGIGTLDEVSDIVELKKEGKHDKPIVLLNTLHFYEGLQSQLIKMHNEGFINRKLEELIYFATTPEEALAYINTQLQQKLTS